MRRAYIIDDHIDTAESLKMLLESEGYAVVTFHDCDTALPVIKNDHPCVVFLDLVMPLGTMPIAEFSRQSRCSVYILSGRHDCDVAAKTLGANGWLRKPYDTDEVARITGMHCPRKT